MIQWAPRGQDMEFLRTCQEHIDEYQASAVHEKDVFLCMYMRVGYRLLSASCVSKCLLKG